MYRTNWGITGGMPIHLDDLAFDRDSIHHALAAIVKGLAGKSHAIISGCLLTDLGSNTWQCSAGYVMLNSVIYRVDEHQVTKDPAEVFHFVVESPIDTVPESFKFFEDGNLHYVHERVRAVMEAQDEADPSLLRTDGLRLTSPIVEIADDLETFDPNDSDNYNFNNIRVAVKTSLFLTHVSIRGTINNTNTSSQNLWEFRLPDIATPGYFISGLCSSTDLSGFKYFSVNENGHLSIRGGLVSNSSDTIHIEFTIQGAV